MPPIVDNSANAADDSSNATPGHVLNPRLRPQRLFQKIEVAMHIAKKKIMDNNQITIAEWISESDMEKLMRVIREIIHKNYDGTFDTWPARVQHDYLPDVREAIIQALHKAITEMWDSLNIPVVDGEQQYDGFVATDFVKPLFWTN
ncbi:hypothetical protein BJ166DRAFT_598773 [Pestalotiopsis sp. NC0098]|nr:hypothetical protein BJ166DRAFT_598773 [Pestalotiopsis sp. NC0098]